MREVVARGADVRADLALALHVDGREIEFAVEVKRNPRGMHVGPLTHRARELEERGEKLLVCAERIPDGQGEAFREHDVAYLDLGGNAYLRAPGLLVLITGRRPARVERGLRDLRGTEVRLLGLYLADPDAGELVQTELAARAGIALGAVGTARERLLRLGLLERRGKRGWRIRNRAEGLRRYGEGWAAVVRHKLLPRAFRMLDRAGQGDLERRLQAAGPELGCLLGGERAAAHLTRHLETEHATLHVPAGRQKEIAKALTLVPDEKGPLTLLERYGRGEEERHVELPGVAFAPTLLVWAECLTVPDERVAQAVQRLHDELLHGGDE